MYSSVRVGSLSPLTLVRAGGELEIRALEQGDEHLAAPEVAP